MIKLLIGLDVGTTNIKAGLFDTDGRLLKVASRPTITQYTDDGLPYYDPEWMWETAAAVLNEASAGADGAVRVLGITSMAEAGLVIDLGTGRAKSHVIPWFDKRSLPQLERVKSQSDPLERFSRSGLNPSFKYGMLKLMWLKDQDTEVLKDACWLSVSDYIAYRLTGERFTDASLAARTYAYDLRTQTWDKPFLEQFGLGEVSFPAVLPAGQAGGSVLPEAAEKCELPPGLPVAVCGHDHLCASVAVGALQPGHVFDSMGTAETLVGVLPERVLGEAEFRTGMSHGKHVLPGRYFWMGGISSSGGSVEWMRKVIQDPPIPYEDMNRMMAEMEHRPTGILYFPYLSGSGAPKPNPNMLSSFVGISVNHTRADMMRAVLEGTVYEFAAIRRAAEQASGQAINAITAVGGGTRNQVLMQIKADVTGCTFYIPSVEEATMLGAALLAGVGSGVYRDEQDAWNHISPQLSIRTVTPDPEVGRLYAPYLEAYLELREPLHAHFNKLAKK